MINDQIFKNKPIYCCYTCIIIIGTYLVYMNNHYRFIDISFFNNAHNMSKNIIIHTKNEHFFFFI